MSSLEIRLNDRLANVELVSRDENKIEIVVDGKHYKLDAVRVEEGIYSIIYKGKSYTIEMIEGKENRKYNVNTLYNTYDVEVIDAETRYLLSRNKSLNDELENTISSPMPGKVIRIMVGKGETIKQGQTLIIVSAMKMESEYKAGKDGKIKEIHVKEGDTIEGNQTLITIE